MKMHYAVAVVAMLLVTLLAGSACTKKPTNSSNENTAAKTPPVSANALPGANGPRLERIGTPPKAIEITDVKVSDLSKSSSSAPPTQQFASGTNKLHLDIELKAKSPPNNKITFDLLSNDGKVALKGAYGSTYAIPSLQIYSFGQSLEPESGTFPDGPYQLKLIMDGQIVAVLNWTVGNK